MKRDARRRMVTTTAKLLRRQGYFGTGLNQIVAEAEAPKGSLYFHFPGGKEQLAAEAITASAAYLDAAMLACEGRTARESLERYLAEAATVLERSNYTEGCPIATVVLEVAPTSPVIGAACARAIELLLARVTGWLERDGWEAAAARQRAELVYSAIEGALILAKGRRSVDPLTTLRRELPTLLEPSASVRESVRPAGGAAPARPRRARPR
jgi:TetR/AcrR family transcriptional repressor of lmrAB and yxaGH operons